MDVNLDYINIQPHRLIGHYVNYSSVTTSTTLLNYFDRRLTDDYSDYIVMLADEYSDYIVTLTDDYSDSSSRLEN